MKSVPMQALAEVKARKPFIGRGRELAVLIRGYSLTKADGRALSSRTRASIHQEMGQMFEVLRQMGCKARPANLKRHHIDKLRAHYLAEHRAGKVAASTLHTRFSILRRFCRELGKPDDFVPSMRDLFPEIEDIERPGATEVDKSWEGNGIAVEDVFERVLAAEPFVAMALLAQSAFGFRRREALCLRPHEAMRLTSAGQVGAVSVDLGAKGGRKRTVTVETDEAREAMATLAAWVLERDGVEGGSIGPQGAGFALASNMRRYDKVLALAGITKAAAGVTGHGLRAQWAMQFLERRGVVPSVRAANGQAAPGLSSEKEREVREAASVQLGHSKPEKLAYYAGAVRSGNPPRQRYV